ncbi:MAG: Crp/Fnr family transcriptional regulator [Lewinellaceae bacterium]|nr:Crp/Fnr family transcriptional regulator [Lewinellaceae bacterium]
MTAFLNAIHPLDTETAEEYSACWHPVSGVKKEILTWEGETEKYIYFVEEGFQRSYYIKDAREYVMAFTYPPSFSGIVESFLTQTPSRYFLECITDSRLLRIAHTDHQKMMNKHRSLETLFRKAAEAVLTGVAERQYELLALSMEERFRAFTQRSAHLLNKVPHKHIASYLRIDPSNFSKLLSKIPI